MGAPATLGLQQGSVAAFDAAQGTGTLLGEGGEPYFFHCVAIADGSRNIAVGTAKYPESGGANAAVGTWHFGSSHTAIIDSREIYWDPNGVSPADGKKGTYVAIYGGARYRLGDFPTGQPPMFSS